MCNVRHELHNTGKKTDKLETLMIRIGMFSGTFELFLSRDQITLSRDHITILTGFHVFVFVSNLNKYCKKSTTDLLFSAVQYSSYNSYCVFPI